MSDLDDYRQQMMLKFQKHVDSTNKIDQSQQLTLPNTIFMDIGDLKILSWNIDGLSEAGLVDRTISAIDDMIEAAPHIICLQEVIPTTLSQIKKLLGSRYHILDARKVEYFVVTCILKDLVKNESAIERGIFNYTNSVMGRNVLVTKFPIKQWKASGKEDKKEIQIEILNTHLESTASYAEKRTVQLAECLEMLCTGYKFSTNKLEDLKKVDSRFRVLCGDLNVRDVEVDTAFNVLSDCGLFPTDPYIWLGKPEKSRFTWDRATNDNLGSFISKCRYRFDRFFYFDVKANTKVHSLRLKTPTSNQRLKLVQEERIEATQQQLIGTNRGSCGLFPSDHYGVLTSFSLISESAPIPVSNKNATFKPVKRAQSKGDNDGDSEDSDDEVTLTKNSKSGDIKSFFSTIPSSKRSKIEQ